MIDNFLNQRVVRPLLAYSRLSLRILLICGLIAQTSRVFSQNGVSISQPEVSFSDNRLIIRYDIRGAQEEDQFRIDLILTDSTGSQITAKSVYGDIGEKVSGPGAKQIIWDLAADEAVLNKGIAVEIRATRPEPPNLAARQDAGGKESEKEPVSSEVKLSAPAKEATKAKTSGIGYNRSNLMLKSALVPGWGLMQLDHGKPYWILGIGAYGCLVSSVYLNHKAVVNYNNYLASTDPAEFDNYFETGERQNKLSKVLAWSAVALWVTDLGLTWMWSAEGKQTASKEIRGNFALVPTYDAINQSRSLSVLYTF
ncbi:MAG: hypothetical protein JW801_09370 [Bacteroidales bacterium]|nr:hypothetical protein [Bacteroidales bacterium]